jgi:hypothetical protein
LWDDKTSTKLEWLALRGTHSRHSFSLKMNGLNMGAKVANFGIWPWFFGRVHGRPHFIDKWREAGAAAPVHSVVPTKNEKRPQCVIRRLGAGCNNLVMTTW